MQEKVVIRDSKPPCAAAAILDPKKGEDGKTMCRFCVDIPGLNSVIKFDK